MANLSLILAASTCVFLISVNSTELSGHPLGAETFEKQLLNLHSYDALNDDELKIYRDLSTQLPEIVLNDHSVEFNRDFFERNSDENAKKSTNFAKHTKKVAKEVKIHKENSYSEGNNMQIMEKKPNVLQKLVKSKKYSPGEMSKQHLTKDGNQISRAFQVNPETEGPLPIADEVPSFLQTWPKYLEELLQPVPIFPELYRNEKASLPDSLPLAKEPEQTTKKTEPNLSGAEIVGNAKKPPSEALEDNLQFSPSYKTLSQGKHGKRESEKISKAKILSEVPQPQIVVDETVQSQKNSYENSAIQSKFPLWKSNFQNLKHTKLAKTNLIDSTAEEDKTGPETHVGKNDDDITHANSEGKLRYRNFMSAQEGESVFLPWSSHKIDSLSLVMPFPELHEERQVNKNYGDSSEESNSRNKRPLPLVRQRVIPETAGPVLYPQSSFEKEFQVPFF